MVAYVTEDFIGGKYGDNIDDSVWEKIEQFHTDRRRSMVLEMGATPENGQQWRPNIMVLRLSKSISIAALSFCYYAAKTFK